MPTNTIDTFLGRFTESIGQGQFVKLTLSDRRDRASDMKNVFIKPVELKSGLHLSFVYRYPTKDITKNYDPKESLEQLRSMIDKDFRRADLMTTTADHHLAVSSSGRVQVSHQLHAPIDAADTSHDRTKKRFVTAENNLYLRELGITTSTGLVKSDKQDKFRQINKYVEIVDSIIRAADVPAGFRIADMGAGKGYLTFALYDHLVHTLHLSPEVTGVEMRPELVAACNKIAEQAGFSGLRFRAGSIDSAEIPDTDMLIALHACDTATDEAISQGIKCGAAVIICAPCCHKQIRKQMHPANDLRTISRYGILEERQAEILTDTIRALIMEAFGYRTKVFEFVPTEHTPKNVMIAGVRSKTGPTDREGHLTQVKNLKAMFGIEYHQLEKLMGI